jgi:hypothetical protein
MPFGERREIVAMAATDIPIYAASLVEFVTSFDGTVEPPPTFDHKSLRLFARDIRQYGVVIGVDPKVFDL